MNPRLLLRPSQRKLVLPALAYKLGMSNAISRGIARLSKRKKKRGELPPIIEQDPVPEGPPIAAVNIEKPSLIGKSMDRLRRSIRQSFRRNRSSERSAPQLVTVTGTRTEAWQPDEAAVRAGVCSFAVKYLGATEVYESRGMPVCENALKHLRSMKRHPVKAILYVSGDGLRVVDQENSRGLMVDQTIEKVSFCAPDRNNDKGFAYICRDGTSRRWMCHGFHACKDSGERLSHAVGCAFAICLEKKKKRDEDNTIAPVTAEQALNPDWGDKSATTSGPSMQRTNNAYQSFRKQISISERLQDPQSAIVNSAPSSSNNHPSASIAKPRPMANPALFQRQGSLRAPEPVANAQFRRNLSLRTNSADSSASPKRTFGTTLNNEPIYEGDEEALVSLAPVCTQSTPASSSLTSSSNNSHLVQSFPTFDSSFMDTSSSPRGGFVNGFGTAPPMSNNVANFNRQISVNTQQVSPPAVPMAASGARTNGSLADNWLNETLRSSISFSSPPPPEMTPSPSLQSLPNGRNAPAVNNLYSNLLDSPRTSGPPPMGAPPPIPQRPPGVSPKNTATNKVPMQNGLVGPSTDVFGQAVNWETVNHVPKPEDPFDIQWSKMVISANNPFASEQPARIST